MKYFILIAIIALSALVLIIRSASSADYYSPLDSYVKAEIQRIDDSTRHAVEVKAFLDNLNNK